MLEEGCENQTIKLGFGIIFSKSSLWTITGLGMAIAFHYSRNWIVDYYNKKRENNNRIDQLPDDILCDIIDHLSAIEASRTMILSKRWREIWTMKQKISFPCLDALDCSKRYHGPVTYRDEQRFINAVNECLHQRLHYGRKVSYFYMRCCFLNGVPENHSMWMQTLAKLDVEVLYLGHASFTCTGKGPKYVLNFSFKRIHGFTRLKILSLNLCNVETSFIGQCVSLVRLSLVYIALVNQELYDILRSCPNLDKLRVRLCKLPLNLRISGSNLKLKTLELVRCFGVQKLEISYLNIIRIININIENEVEISMSSVPMLVDLKLSTPRANYCFGDVLPQLKFFLIQTSYQMMQLPPKFHMFCNVRTLWLMTSDYNYQESSMGVDLWNFAPVLNACPFLERFYLTLQGPVSKERPISE